MKTSRYEARMLRAEYLAEKYPFAGQILQFFQHITRFQSDLSARIPELRGGGQPVGPPEKQVRSELNLALLLPYYPTFLTLVRQHAPEPLAQAAEAVAAKGAPAWIELFEDHWASGGKRVEESEDAKEDFLCRGFLQPFAEVAAERKQAPIQSTASLVCPLCEARPVAGILRPEGDGGKRFLLCSFCGHEWEFRRILCASCGEEREGQLPVFVAEQFPQIRVEACDTCRHFLRTIDLTKDGNAMPIVDDLAAIPLTLWADEHGYKRIEPNLLKT
ncbi:MAG: formate dehydrogenase accessory protein FdhE [Acidobacteria bacterium]|nr:formate dehydrogenase accessory protein FdhE [Acidobacteriota bacterium]MBS1864751.1 formate dehydrogenase accessory protein FdhE [Acidobacteriota bacterium]